MCAFLALGNAAAATAQESNPALEQYLTRLGIDAKQRATLARGQVVAKLLPTSDNRDVAIFGIVAVNISRDSAAARAMDVERFLAGRGLRAHPFGNPPSPNDVSDAGFAESEYRSLRNCRPGDCDFKLSASEMAAFVEQIDWSSRDARAQADARLRDQMLRLVGDYTKRGDAALPTYDDGRTVQSAAAFADLIAQSTDVYPHAPELQQYLTTYPAGRPDGARDFLYWSEERLPHLRPTLTVDHVVVYVSPADTTGPIFVARKQLYADHYFEGALELLAMVDAGTGGVYLLMMRRFRFDALPGGLLNIRGRVRRGLLDAADADLERQRSALEQVSRTP